MLLEGDEFMSNKVNISMIIVGIIGMVVIALVSIIDSKATDITSAIPVQLFFAAIFIAGYMKYKEE